MVRGRPKSQTTLEQYKVYFNSHISIDDDGCHRWIAAKNNTGYGLFRYNGKMCSAHRVMMEWEGHDIEGKQVYHTCDSYNCCNPAHLKVGTVLEKAQSIVDKGHSGIYWKDPKYHRQCIHCSYFGSPAVLSHFHDSRCKHKPI